MKQFIKLSRVRSHSSCRFLFSIEMLIASFLFMSKLRLCGRPAGGPHSKGDHQKNTSVHFPQHHISSVSPYISPTSHLICLSLYLPNITSHTVSPGPRNQCETRAAFRLPFNFFKLINDLSVWYVLQKLLLLFACALLLRH